MSGGPLDPNQSGGALDGICSAVRDLKACPSNSLPCTYETITLDKQSYGKVSVRGSAVLHVVYLAFYSIPDVLVKRPCSPPPQPAKCKTSKDNEKQCVNDGCTWTRWIPKYSEYNNIKKKRRVF